MTARARAGAAWPWLLGGGAGVAVLGPALGPGSLLNLDLVLMPRIPVPTGIWGLGPDLPRRVPYGAVMAWASEVIGGPVAGKVVLLVAVAAAVAGAARLVAGQAATVRLGAGLLYGLSPFLLTRVGIGHIGVVVAYGLLPWALPALLRPSDRPRAAVGWALAMGLTGFAGGVLTLVLVTVGAVADRTRRAALVAVGTLAAQLPWVVPGVVVTLSSDGLDPAGAEAFATDLDGPAGLLRLVAGHGFWRASSQVGGGASGPAVLLGAVLLVLAVAGASRLPSAWRARATAAAAIGIGLAAASAVPGVDGVYTSFADSALGAPAREGQRWLALFVVWMAPAAALGAVRVMASPGALVPAGVALALAGPSLWGLDGRLEPVDLPDGWAEAEQAIAARPGPVVALPWHQYLDLSVADGRRVLHPLPDYLGGDVLTASDPEIGGGRRERADPREPVVDALLGRVEVGDPVSGELARAGFRWVAVLREVDADRWDALGDDLGLTSVVADDHIELYRVLAWRGPAVDGRGRAVDVDQTIAPMARVAGDDAVTWHRPGLDGWARGGNPTSRTDEGTLRVRAGDAPLWYRPTAVVLLAYICTVVLGGALLMGTRVGTVRGGTANEEQYGRGS